MYQGLSREQTQQALLNAIIALTNAVSGMPTVAVQQQLRDLALADQQTQSALLAAAKIDPVHQTDLLAALGLTARDTSVQALLPALTSILGKLPASPSTEATLSAAASSLTAILAKLPATPATEATLAALSAKTNKAIGSTKDYTLQPAPTSAQLAPANSLRRGMLLSNGANLPTFFRFGSTASLTSFSVMLPVGGSVLLPAITSAVHVVCASGVVTVIAGMVSMTELLD